MASVRREIDFSKTADDLLRKIPGWKPPVTAPVDGEAAVEVEHQGGEERQSIIPEFNMTQKFEYVTKNATDTTRQQNLEEIHSIRDYLAGPHIKRDDKDKAYKNIPLMKTFERAIMIPDELQCDLNAKRYPSYGEFLMENPFPKKKKKGKKGKKVKPPAGMNDANFYGAGCLRHISHYEAFKISIAELDGERYVIPLLNSKLPKVRWHARAILLNLATTPSSEIRMMQFGAPKHMVQLSRSRAGLAERPQTAPVPSKETRLR